MRVGKYSFRWHLYGWPGRSMFQHVPHHGPRGGRFVLCTDVRIVLPIGAYRQPQETLQAGVKSEARASATPTEGAQVGLYQRGAGAILVQRHGLHPRRDAVRSPPRALVLFVAAHEPHYCSTPATLL